jgi:2-polyprenyl-3-methyl-5-hydroxy-6-metoxy-1,4-benzoquinol methylase
MNQEEIQEEEYDFPYHHLVNTKPFSETQHLFWGYKYAGYVEKILDTLSGMPFDSLIEIGCGDGKVLTEISKRYPDKRLVGMDYSEKSLCFAKAFSPHLTFQTKTSEKFDCFVLVEVLEHINPKDMTSFLDSVSKNLNDDGFGIMTTPCDNIPLNPKHYQHFNKQSIENTLGTHFKIISLEYTSAHTFGVKIIQRLLANRFFILNEKFLMKKLYTFYKRHYLHATEQNASQLFVIIKKR